MNTFFPLKEYPLLQRAAAALEKPLVLADVQLDQIRRASPWL